MMGGMQADQSISFQAMQQKLTQLIDIVQHDPAVQSVVGFTGAGSGGGGGSDQYRLGLRRAEAAGAARRHRRGDGRLRRALSVVPGARLFLMPIQDIRIGGRQSNAAYQFTLQADNTADCCTNGRRSCWRRWNTTRCCAMSIPTSSRTGWKPIC